MTERTEAKTYLIIEDPKGIWNDAIPNPTIRVGRTYVYETISHGPDYCRLRSDADDELFGESGSSDG